MMKLATMERVIAKLDEDRLSPIADEIALRWEPDEGTVRFFRASSNFLFTFEHAGQGFVLRFVDAAERSRETIRAELDFVDSLAARGVPVARALPSLKGNPVETISIEQGTWNAVVFKRLQGNSFELEELSPEQVEQWGRALGELHNAAEGYPTAGRPSWHDHLALVKERWAQSSTADRILNELERLEIRRDNFGLIHYDFEPDNLVWNGSRAGIVDFDDCAAYWFAADIAYALRDLFADSPNKVNMDHEDARQFVRGYRSARQIDEAEIEQIPMFLALHNLVSTIRIEKALEPRETTGAPEWMSALRNKLEAKIAYYENEALVFTGR